MQRTLKSLLPLTAALVCALVITAQADDKKVDPTGTWTWTTTFQDQTRQSTAKLKLDGDKLIGTVSGRQSETPITDAKISGDEISFKVTRERQGNKFTTKYVGKISGDIIKGKSESERDGQTRSTDWTAKREAAKAK